MAEKKKDERAQHHEPAEATELGSRFPLWLVNGRSKTDGTVPHEVVTIRSGNLPMNCASSGSINSSPTSSRVSRTAVALSSSSSGSRFPPGKATWLVHLSFLRAARLINSTSGSPCCTHGCSKKWLLPSFPAITCGAELVGGQ